MTVLGISSSAIKHGNVDRMIQFVLEKSAKQSEFINLTELSYSPCMACAHLCARDNLCKLDDDLKVLYPKMIHAEVIVLGTPCYSNSMNGFMSVFLERLWAFRHQRFPLEGKPFAVVSSGAVCAPEETVEAVKRRMTFYRAVFVGSVAFHSGNYTCFKCGYGTRCEVGGTQREFGDEGRKELKITKELFRKWEDSPEVVAEIEGLVQRVTTLETALCARPQPLDNSR